MYCPQCDTRMPASARFCMNCGTSMANSDDEVHTSDELFIENAWVLHSPVAVFRDGFYWMPDEVWVTRDDVRAIIAEILNAE